MTGEILYLGKCYVSKNYSTEDEDTEPKIHVKSMTKTFHTL